MGISGPQLENLRKLGAIKCSWGQFKTKQNNINKNLSVLMAGGFAELLLNNRSQGIKDLQGSSPLLSTLRYAVGRVSACTSKRWVFVWVRKPKINTEHERSLSLYKQSAIWYFIHWLFSGPAIKPEEWVRIKTNSVFSYSQNMYFLWPVKHCYLFHFRFLRMLKFKFTFLKMC